MIWYVATLIASVFSTRGTAAQGELKCNICCAAHSVWFLLSPCALAAAFFFTIACPPSSKYTLGDRNRTNGCISHMSRESSAPLESSPGSSGRPGAAWRTRAPSETGPLGCASAAERSWWIRLWPRPVLWQSVRLVRVTKQRADWGNEITFPLLGGVGGAALQRGVWPSQPSRWKSS